MGFSFLKVAKSHLKQVVIHSLANRYKSFDVNGFLSGCNYNLYTGIVIRHSVKSNLSSYLINRLSRHSRVKKGKYMHTLKIPCLFHSLSVLSLKKFSLSRMLDLFQIGLISLPAPKQKHQYFIEIFNSN